MPAKRSLELFIARVVLFTFAFILLGGLAWVPAHSDNPVNPTPTAGPSTGRAPALFPLANPPLTFFPFVPYYRSDLALSAVQVIQGSALSPSYAVYVADRLTMLRAYVTVNDGTRISSITARLFGFNETGKSVGWLDSNAVTAPSLESAMASTLNFKLPASWSKPGYSYYIQLDPNNTIVELNKNNNRYPTSGTMAFNFTNVAPLKVTIVPIVYLPYGLPVPTIPKIDDLSYLEWMPGKVLPVSIIEYDKHDRVDFAPAMPSENLDNPNGDGWLMLLDQLSALHSFEDPSGSRLYYGLVNTYDAHGCANGCITGMGWIGGYGYQPPTALGWSGMPDGAPSASKTFTHEMGHNLGREHVYCAGTESEPDPFYPYGLHSIGTWGLDVASGNLYDPDGYADFMSYCEPVWTSDYTYQGIKAFRDQHYYDVRSDSAPVPAYFISGRIAPDGRVTLAPVYQQVAPVAPPSQGAYSVELLGADGRVLASHAFTPSRIGNSAGAAGFGFFVPAVNGLTGLRVRRDGQVAGATSVAAPLASADFATRPLSVQRAANGATVAWARVSNPSAPVVYRVRLSQDGGGTWKVLAVGLREPRLTLPPGIDLTNARLEVQASDGVHVATRTYRLN